MGSLIKALTGEEHHYGFNKTLEKYSIALGLMAQVCDVLIIS
jgi:hypothetical protein